MINEEVMWCVDIAGYMVIKFSDNFRIYEAIYDFLYYFCVSNKAYCGPKINACAKFSISEVDYKRMRCILYLIRPTPRTLPFSLSFCPRARTS